MANPKSYRDRRNSPAADLETETDAPDFRTNAYPEHEYEANRRLPTRRTYDWQSGEFSDTKDPLSDRVKSQVLTSVGAHSGSMTFASQLDRSRGVGDGYNTPADNRGSAQIKKGEKL
jgi:hypothetical protein